MCFSQAPNLFKIERPIGKLGGTAVSPDRPSTVNTK
jgi:hypothetical protein